MIYWREETSSSEEKNFLRLRNTSDIKSDITGERGIIVSKNQNLCLWIIEGFKIIKTKKGNIKLKAYLINEKGKSYSYPLIDLEKLDVGVDVSWEEIFRSNVTVLITDDWSNQMWGDILVLEKYGVSISVKIYATGNLVFHILTR